MAHDRHYACVTKSSARHAAVQVGEFAVGAVAAYAAVGAVWVASGATWAPILAAAALVAIAVAVEVKYGERTTGLVVGLLPTALLTAGLLTAFSMVLSRVR
jgi:hypothetical protein